MILGLIRGILASSGSRNELGLELGDPVLQLFHFLEVVVLSVRGDVSFVDAAVQWRLGLLSELRITPQVVYDLF